MGRGVGTLQASDVSNRPTWQYVFFSSPEYRLEDVKSLRDDLEAEGAITEIKKSVDELRFNDFYGWDLYYIKPEDVAQVTARATARAHNKGGIRMGRGADFQQNDLTADNRRAKNNDSKTALIIVDVQYDFMPGGALAVPGGDQVVAPLARHANEVDYVVVTADYHPEDHCSFEQNGGIWPVHCVRGQRGSEISEELLAAVKPDLRVDKGTNAGKEAYSGFDGTDLAEKLRAQKVKTVLVGGLATDYCVKATVLDGLKEGFEVRLLIDSCRGVDIKPGDSEQAIREMAAAGAVIT